MYLFRVIEYFDGRSVSNFLFNNAGNGGDKVYA